MPSAAQDVGDAGDVGAADMAIGDMAADMAASLRAFLETRAIDPLVREYGNHSWALIQLLRYYRSRGDLEGSNWVAARIEAHYLVYDAGAALAIDHSRRDFFSLWGNWALLLGLYDEGKLRDWLPQQQIADDALRPIARANSAHQLGINPSRAWGLWWAHRATGESRFGQAIDAHWSQMRDTHASRGADYFAYGHWVPQFALYAITQPLE